MYKAPPLPPKQPKTFQVVLAGCNTNRINQMVRDYAGKRLDNKAKISLSSYSTYEIFNAVIESFNK